MVLSIFARTRDSTALQSQTSNRIEIKRLYYVSYRFKAVIRLLFLHVQFSQRYSADKYVLRLEITRFTGSVASIVSVKFQ